MRVKHLDLLHEQLPDLFAIKTLPENWDDELIIVSVPEIEPLAESVDATSEEESQTWSDEDEIEIYDDVDQPEGVILDQFGRDHVGLSIPSPFLGEEITQVLGGTHGGGHFRTQIAAGCHRLTA
jgi:hypothetical protein